MCQKGETLKILNNNNNKRLCVAFAESHAGTIRNEFFVDGQKKKKLYKTNKSNADLAYDDCTNKRAAWVRLHIIL